MPVPLILAAAVLLVVAGGAADLFILTGRRNRAVQSWRVVDTLLQRRHALVAMVLDDARGPETEPVRVARRAAISAGVLTDPAGTARAEQHLMTAMARLTDAAGRDRTLRGDARLHAPLDRLRTLDGPLEVAITDYNDRVAAYRRAATRFPGPLLTSAFDLGLLTAYAVAEPDPAPRRTIGAPAADLS